MPGLWAALMRCVKCMARALSFAPMICACASRPPMLLAGTLFVLEAVRVHMSGGLPTAASRDRGSAERLRATWEKLDKPALTRALVLFALPIAFVIGIESWMNHLRFETWNPNVGHEYLTVAWAGRMKKWGLFSTHYLAKNLGVALTLLPWLPPKGTPSIAPFQINEHGLAIWFTIEVYCGLFQRTLLAVGFDVPIGARFVLV